LTCSLSRPLPHSKGRIADFACRSSFGGGVKGSKKQDETHEFNERNYSFHDFLIHRRRREINARQHCSEKTKHHTQFIPQTASD
jgi:N-acetyl-gamma-glutamylphosphate reductase